MSPPKKDQVPDLLGILAIFVCTAAGSAIGGPLGSGVIAAIGVNLGGSLVQQGGSRLKEKWLSSKDGALNHGIQKALAHAFENALDNIQNKYFNLPRDHELPSGEKRYIKQLFRQLKDEAHEGFLESLMQVTQEQALQDYLYQAEEATVNDELWQQIEQTDVLPDGYENFKEFLRKNLFAELQFCFGEELKKDNKESNKAWRAFQRLLLEGTQAEVAAVRASQDRTEQDLQEIQQDLQKLASVGERLEELRYVTDSRSPDEPFQQGLERAVDQIGMRLEELYRIAQRTEGKVDTANTKLDFIINTLDGPRIERHAGFTNTAPPLPPNFVPRSEELDQLRQTIVRERNDDGPVALTSLRGMGGIGKTALAIALCHDGGLQETFPDGVLWVDIGRETDKLAGKMGQVGQALGDWPGYYDNPEVGTARLQRLLEDKAVLLVLDDVWDARHIEPFLVNAPHCRVLFTTRNADIALGLGAREMLLGMLEPEQAISLLREWTGRGEPVFPEIAERLGYLPLALKLVGAQLSEGMSGKKWLEILPPVSDINLSPFPTDNRQESLKICLDLSVGELPEEKDRLLYYALGIFPEDVRIPQSVVVRLWRELRPELTEFQCHKIVTELARRALLDLNAFDETVTLHELLREYTREQLGGELAATHAALLSAYNPDGKPWPQIEHDGYLYHHLAYHLHAAGRAEELYELLTGSPDWMEAKFVACTGDAAYVADLNLAIGDFTDPLAAAEVLTLVKLHTARQVVNERVSSYSDTDLQTLVWLGREDEALAHARLRSKQTGAHNGSVSKRGKFEGLLTVYHTLKEKGLPNPFLLHEIQEIARSIEDYGKRSGALSAVAAALAQTGDGSRAGELFGEALEIARSIEDYGNARSIEDYYGKRSEALSAVAAALAQAERYEEALEAARSIESGFRKSIALGSVASDFAQAGRHEEALEVARSIGNDLMRSNALSAVASALAEVACALARAGRHEEALEAARGIRDDQHRSEALSSVASALARTGDGSRAEKIFGEALEIARSIRNDLKRSEALSAVASALAETGHFNYALTILDVNELDVFLQALAEWASPFERVTPGLLADVLREATGIAGWVHSDWHKTYELLNS